MKKISILILVAALLAVALTAYGGNPEENAVRGVVRNAEQALEDAVNGKGDIATISQYYATSEEGAHAAGLVNTRDAFVKMVNDHVSGVSLLQISNFRITDVSVHESAGLARVTYQMDIRIVHGAQQGTATISQNLALLKTATRGWHISGGDEMQDSKIVGRLP